MSLHLKVYLLVKVVSSSLQSEEIETRISVFDLSRYKYEIPTGTPSSENSRRSERNTDLVTCYCAFTTFTPESQVPVARYLYLVFLIPGSSKHTL